LFLFPPLSFVFFLRSLFGEGVFSFEPMDWANPPFREAPSGLRKVIPFPRFDAHVAGISIGNTVR